MHGLCFLQTDAQAELFGCEIETVKQEPSVLATSAQSSANRRLCMTAISTFSPLKSKTLLPMR